MVLPIYRDIYWVLFRYFLLVMTSSRTFNYDLGWNDYFSSIYRKVWVRRWIQENDGCIFFSVRIRLVVAFLISFFLFSLTAILYTLHLTNIRWGNLQWLLMLVLGYGYRRRLFNHIFDVSDSILGCSLLTYMVFWLACFMFLVLIFIFFNLLYYLALSEHKILTHTGSLPNTW
jgi:hypothetical protein